MALVVVAIPASSCDSECESIGGEMLSRISISKTRIEALSDGVFAIVMTLLVLQLKVPDLPRHASSRELLAALRQEAPLFLTFLITFVISGVFWFTHQLSFP